MHLIGIAALRIIPFTKYLSMSIMLHYKVFSTPLVVLQIQLLVLGNWKHNVSMGQL